MKKSAVLLFSLLFTLTLAAADVLDVHLFPVDFQRGNYQITEKYPYRVIVKFKGNVWELHKNPPNFVIELPAQVKLLRAGTRLVPLQDIPFTTEKISRDGGEFIRYTIALPTRKLNYNPKNFIWRSGFDLYLEADKGSAGKSWNITCHFEDKGEKVLSRNFNLGVLPEIPANRKAFKNFRFSVKEFPSAGHPDTSILQRQLDMWCSFAPKLYMSWTWETYLYPEESRKLLNEHAEFFFWTFACYHSTMILNNSGTDDLGFSVANKVTRPGVPLFHGPNGEIHKGAICPQYLIKDPEGLFYGDYLRRAIAKARAASPGMKSFIIDYEPIAGGGTCDECMKDFARFAKLKTVPSREEIKPGKPLNRSWQLYKIQQNKIIMNKIADAVRKHYPDMQVSFCSTELRPAADVINTWDAVDVGAVENKTDFYSFMIYSTGATYYKYLSYAVNHLRKAKSFPWIDPAEEDERFFARYSPEKVRQNIIATVALNAMGLMIYPTDTLDGRYMSIIAETCDILAGVEDIYNGRNLNKHVKSKVLNTSKLNLFDEKGNLTVAEYPNLNEQVKTHLHEKNGIYLLSILNYANEKAIIEVAIPEYKGGMTTGSDLINKRNYAALSADAIRNGFVVELNAGGSAVIQIGGTPGSFVPVYQENIREELKKAAAADNNSIYKTVSKGNAAIQWRSFKNSVMITLVNGENYVSINPGANARIEEWAVDRAISTGRPSGLLGEVIFYDPSQTELREYTVSRIDLDGANPAVILTSTIKADTDAGGSGNQLAGLILEKRIELTLNGTIIMTDTLINPTDKDMQPGFRVKHTPYSAWRAGIDPVVTLGGKTMLPGIYIKPGVQLDWYAAKGAKELHADAVFTMKAGRSNYTFEYPGAIGVYFWKNQVLHTAEAIYPQFTLKAKEKYSVTTKIGYFLK